MKIFKIVYWMTHEVMNDQMCCGNDNELVIIFVKLQTQRIVRCQSRLPNSRQISSLIQTWQRLMHNIKSLDKKLFFHLNLELIEIFNKFINNFLFFCWFSKIIIMLLFLDKFSYLILNFTEKLDYLGNCELTEFKLQIYQIKFLIWYFVKWFLYHALD